jgi:hypothetical protein
MQDYELIIDALDWKLIYHNEAREYMCVDKNTGTFVLLDCIAQLTYDINNTPTDEFDTLFNNDCCGEKVFDDHITFYWFKERIITIDIKGVDL